MTHTTETTRTAPHAASERPAPRAAARRRMGVSGTLAKFAMASWVLLAAMPVAVLILTFT